MPVPIVVPPLNELDERCVLGRWLCTDGAAVEADAPLAELETDKATFELVAPAAGRLAQGVGPGEAIAFGAIVGHLLAEGETRPPPPAPSPPPDPPAARLQAAIARRVVRSHATIPPAFLLVRVLVDAALARLASVAKESDTYVGLPEAFVGVTAGLAEAFPEFFPGRPAGRGPDIGVTFDTGRGLFVPVVRDPRSLPLPALAQVLMDFRLRAHGGTFRAHELEGGHASISLARAKDVVLSVPLVVPGQAAMLSVGADLEELWLAPDGTVAPRRYVHLGLAYDHRSINGFAASRFLGAIKARVEAAEPT